MRNIPILFIAMFITTSTFAQNKRKERQEQKKEQISQIVRQEEEGVITYNKSFVFGAKLTTDGYGAFFEWGRATSVKKSLLFQIEIAERKHIKEDKQGSIYSQTVPFVYGKINYFYPVKLGVQQQILLGNKSNKNGVSVTGNYGGGITLGLLRPYYVQVQKDNSIEYVKYNSPDSLAFLTDRIYGGPSLGRGWSELKVTPGLYGKIGLRFDYGAYNELVSAIEVGVTGEYYSKKIPQMVYNEQKQFFYGAYFSILFGKRK